MSAAPAVRPRPAGGFNQGIGFFNEHLDEDAMQTAVQQKALGQQGTVSSQPTTGGSALGSQTPPGTAGTADHAGQPPSAEPPTPREVGTIPEELIARPAQDIKVGLLSIFDLNALLDINPATDDPETQAHKRETLKRFQELEQEDQAVVRETYKRRMEEKQQEQQKEQLKKQQAAEAQAQELVMPSSPHNGPVGPAGDHKPRAVQKLEQDRKTLGGPQGVG